MICGRCGRRLKDPESIKIGYGPVCRAELGIETERKSDRKSNRSFPQFTDAEKEFDIPGQMSIFDNPEWIPDNLEEESNG